MYLKKTCSNWDYGAPYVTYCNNINNELFYPYFSLLSLDKNQYNEI